MGPIRPADAGEGHVLAVAPLRGEHLPVDEQRQAAGRVVRRRSSGMGIALDDMSALRDELAGAAV